MAIDNQDMGVNMEDVLINNLLELDEMTLLDVSAFETMTDGEKFLADQKSYQMLRNHFLKEKASGMHQNLDFDRWLAFTQEAQSSGMRNLKDLLTGGFSDIQGFDPAIKEHGIKYEVDPQTGEETMIPEGVETGDMGALLQTVYGNDIEKMIESAYRFHNFTQGNPDITENFGNELEGVKDFVTNDPMWQQKSPMFMDYYFGRTDIEGEPTGAGEPNAAPDQLQEQKQIFSNRH